MTLRLCKKNGMIIKGSRGDREGRTDMNNQIIEMALYLVVGVVIYV